MQQVRWLDDDEDRAWRGWVRLSERVRAAVGRDLAREHALSEAEYAVLVHLSEAEDCLVRMTDLAVGLDWSRSRLSHLVTRMEARGLLVRQECPSDARGSFASLTDAGRAEITRAAPSHVASVRRHLIDHLDHGEIQQLGVIIASALERMDRAGCDTTEDECAEPSGAVGTAAASPCDSDTGGPAVDMR